MIRFAAALVFFLAMVPTAGSATDMSDQEFAWVERCKDSVRAILRDGESARFKQVFFTRGPGNAPMACGKVNAKNGFGGYTGWQGFVSAGRPDLTFLQTSVSDFTDLWNRICR